MAENNPPQSIALIMAGGSGTRFWPLSRKNRPKQYLNLTGSQTLIQSTVDRLRDIIPTDRTFVCTVESQVALVRANVPNITGIILEPAAKNTAPCLMLSVAELLRQGFAKDTVMAVFPSDHVIQNRATFQSLLKKGIEFAKSSQGLVTLGIKPTHPHTGFGYIESGKVTASEGVFHVSRFVEKPNESTAKEYLARGNFYWNGGIFIWTLGAITAAFESFLKQDWQALQHARGTADLPRTYQGLTPQAIDTAVLEKAGNVFVIPADMGWSDVGSWNALYDLKDKDPNANAVISGKVRSEKSSACLVHTQPDKKVVLVGVKDLVVVDTGDTLMILNRHEDQLVRNVAED